MRHLDQSPGLAWQVTRHIHPAGIAEPAIHNDRHINIGDIAIRQNLGPRNAVTHDMVHRYARRVPIAFITNRGGGTAPAFNLGSDKIV